MARHPRPGLESDPKAVSRQRQSCGCPIALRAPRRTHSVSVSLRTPAQPSLPGHMRRRTLIQSALGLAAMLPFPRVRTWALGTAFPGTQEDTLRKLAATVLPSSLGRVGTDNVAAEFADWVSGYRVGAEMSPGYGSPRVRYKGASPAPVFQRQLQALAAGALASDDLVRRRRLLAEELLRAGITDLTNAPRGEHVVADLMSFWFASPAAHDLAYQASIGKDRCRTLESSAQVPAPLVKR
jgi:hypothetical protein